MGCTAFIAVAAGYSDGVRVKRYPRLVVGLARSQRVAGLSGRMLLKTRGNKHINKQVEAAVKMTKADSPLVQKAAA